MQCLTSKQAAVHIEARALILSKINVMKPHLFSRVTFFLSSHIAKITFQKASERIPYSTPTKKKRAAHKYGNKMISYPNR
jgi:hypothetical protein